MKSLRRVNWGDEAWDGFGRTSELTWWTVDQKGPAADLVRYALSDAEVRTFRAPLAIGEKEGLAHAFDYDGRDRLIAATRGVPEVIGGTKLKTGAEIYANRWLLDETGNWRAFLADADGGGSEDLLSSNWSLRLHLVHNTMNQITAIRARKGGQPVAFDYDDAGNTTVIPQPNDPGTAYHCRYDAWNRLVLVSEPLGKGKSRTIAEYQYDALGRRTIKKTYDNGQLAEVRHFYYSPDWHVLEERIVKPQDLAKYDQNVKRLTDNQLIVDRLYVWGQNGRDDLVARFRKTASPTGTQRQNSLIDENVDEKLFALSDANGQPTALVDEDANVLERFDYHPYGFPLYLTPDFLIKSDSDYDWTNLFGNYTHDRETGLYHVRNRMYHPWFGRWLTPDPSGYTDGPNLYQYVKGSPLNLTDPSGAYIESAWDAASLTVGVASLINDIEEGQWGWAIVDAVGIIADAVALALPIVPGGVGIGVKALRTIGVGIDAASAVSRSVRIANAVSDITKVADFGANAIQTYDAYRRGDPLGIVLGTLGLSMRGVQGGFMGARRIYGRNFRWYDDAERLGREWAAHVELSYRHTIRELSRRVGPIEGRLTGRQLQHLLSAEIVIPLLGTAGRQIRIAPIGNRFANFRQNSIQEVLVHQLPHYHRVRRNPANPRLNLQGQTMRRHRPWESHPTDTRFRDRF